MLDDKSFVLILWLHATTAVSPVNPVLGVTSSGICSPGVTASSVVLCAKSTAWLVGGRRVLLVFYCFNQKIFKINGSFGSFGSFHGCALQMSCPQGDH